jgi:hypothetical protein
MVLRVDRGIVSLSSNFLLAFFFTILVLLEYAIRFISR